MSAERYGRAWTVPVDPAFRFDLTFAVFRGFASNLVDRVARDGSFVRAQPGAAGLEIWAIRRVAPDALVVRVSGRDADAADGAVVRRRFGIDRATPRFDAAAEHVPWLADFARRARGLRPSQLPTLWEACAHAIVFQSVSLFSATALLARTIVALERPLDHAGTTLFPFPSAAACAAAPADLLLAAGLSRAKAATLIRTAQAIAGGTLDATVLETASTAALAATLQTISGIGPWTASVVALRAFGRLDTFPPGDSGIARKLAASGASSADLALALAAFGDERGMLYHYAHLERIVRAGDATLE